MILRDHRLSRHPIRHRSGWLIQSPDRVFGKDNRQVEQIPAPKERCVSYAGGGDRRAQDKRSKEAGHVRALRLSIDPPFLFV
jgi:hypothetical protein